MILIVGGAGYIGAHVNKELSRKGYDTIVLDNLAAGHEDLVRWGKLVKGDMADRGLLERIFRDNRIKAVMHFAAHAYVGESVSDPAKYYVNNVSKTLVLLEAMRKAGAGPFIFSSSCATYGEPERVPIPEEHPQRPINPYGRTKLIVENILADYSAAYGLKYAALRYFNAAGADPESEIGEWHEPETHLIPLVLDAASGRRPDIKIFGTDYDTPDGTCVRDYIHVTDLADAHIRAMEKLLSGGKNDRFNLGNGEGFSVKQVIEEAREVTGKDIPAVETGRRPGDPPVLVGSSGKARETLGWSPKYNDLKTILETAWKWHQKKWA